jgi:hypothetical protein
MRHADFDGKNGAERVRPLLTAFAATRNNPDCQISDVD